jgi:predicted dehydrogenase
VRAYRDNADVEVVALVDPSEERRAERSRDWPDARAFASVADLAASGVAVDAVEALLPIPLHVDGVVDLLGHGWHVNLQKPMCNTLPDAQRMLDAARTNDRVLRVMENYLFYEPLQKLKATIEDGTIGDVVGYHLKMVASGRGGWDVPMSSYEWQFMQMRDHARGILVFDDGWHKLATAIWLSVRSPRCGRGSARPRWCPASAWMRPRRSRGSTRTACGACGTSRSRPTSTCGPTTTRTTSGGRSPAAPASRV